MASMASAPRFKTPQHMPPASGWKAGHRAPGSYEFDGERYGGFFGQLDGVCLEDSPALDQVSTPEKRAFPGDSTTGDRY